MKNTIDVFCGIPLELESEKAFLAKLKEDLSFRGESGLILANFFPSESSHQIDFLVVTSRSVCHVELKTLTAPVVGGLNGLWSLVRPDGLLKPHGSKNPYRQALDGKIAISDELHAFTNSDQSLPNIAVGDRFFKHFESVVCVYPELLPGSRVPSDYKVRVCGYPALLTRLARGTKQPPGWTRETWVAFAMHLALVRSEEDGEKLPADLRDAQLAIEEYRHRLSNYLTLDLSPLVKTTLLKASSPVEFRMIEESVLSGRHMQLVGKSGSGKSLLMKHLMLNALEHGLTPLIISARDYAGKLSSLFDRAIAHLHPDTGMHLLKSAERCGARLVLVVDGFNECPVKGRESLLRDIQAFCLRWNFPVHITTQEAVRDSQLLGDAVFEFAPLTNEERAAILQAHCTGLLPPEYLELCTPFETAYELSLAAAYFTTERPATTRATLFDAYVTRRCENTDDPIIVRTLLCRLAAHMNRHYVSSTSMTEARREALRFLNKSGGNARHFNDALKSGLVDCQQNLFAFKHEMLERFFQAESLMQEHDSIECLAHTVALPSNRQAAEFVLGMESDAKAIRHYLEELADIDILQGCLRGTFGPVAKEVATADCNKLLSSATLALDEIEVGEVDVTDVFTGPLTIAGPEWSRYDIALMNSIGSLLVEGHFIEEVLQLTRLTDEAWLWKLRHRPDGMKATLGQVDSAFRNIYTFAWSKDARFLPISLIHNASRVHWFADQSPNVARAVEQLLSNLPALTFGEKAWLCEMMRYPRAEFAPHVPLILDACWKTRIYHLRLMVTQMAMSWGATLHGEDRTLTVELLNSYLTNNHVMLNTLIFDVLKAFDEIDGTVTGDDIDERITAVLSNPTDADAQQRAYVIVTSMLDDLEPDKYYEAVDRLPQDSYAQLFTMAALGAEHTLFSEWILGKLLESDNPIALPAFQRWATVPRERDSSPQNAVASYVRALTGCAKHMRECPVTGDYGGGDRQAWALYGQIIFWLASPDATNAERVASCRLLWERLRTELPFEAVDPLFQLEHAAIIDREQTAATLLKILELFPNDVREILEFGLKHLGKLTTLLHRFDDTELTVFVIRYLGDVGNSENAKLIEPYCESPTVGRWAVEAMRKLRARA
jgi:hypothetical protein